MTSSMAAVPGWAVASPSEPGGGAVEADKVIRCACGQEWRGPLADLVPLVQRHGLNVHNMAATPEQVRAMAVDAESVGDDADPSGPA